MSDLDDKLREIYLTIDECPESKVCGTCIKLADDFVAQIKQAFADEGYATVRKDGYRDRDGKEYTQYTIKYPDGTGEFARVPFPRVEDATTYPLVWAKSNGYKTGQEWYDRFTEEVNKEMIVNPHENITDQPLRIIEAAKKASNL